MEFNEIVEKIKEKYLEIDKKSGSLFLLAVLFEEVGELAEAVRKNDGESVEEELADVLFMVISLSNLYGCNVERRLIEKFIKGNPLDKWDLPRC